MEDESVQTDCPGLVIVALSREPLQDDQGQVDGRLGQNDLLQVLLQPAEDGQDQLHVLAAVDGLLHHPAARLDVDQLEIRKRR